MTAIEEPSDGPYLREQAAKCRRLAASVTDEASRNALLNLAAQYEQNAACADSAGAASIIRPRPELKS